MKWRKFLCGSIRRLVPKGQQNSAQGFNQVSTLGIPTKHRTALKGRQIWNWQKRHSISRMLRPECFQGSRR